MVYYLCIEFMKNKSKIDNYIKNAGKLGATFLVLSGLYHANDAYNRFTSSSRELYESFSDTWDNIIEHIKDHIPSSEEVAMHNIAIYKGFMSQEESLGNVILFTHNIIVSDTITKQQWWSDESKVVDLAISLQITLQVSDEYQYSDKLFTTPVEVVIDRYCHITNCKIRYNDNGIGDSDNTWWFVTIDDKEAVTQAYNSVGNDEIQWILNNDPQFQKNLQNKIILLQDQENDKFTKLYKQTNSNAWGIYIDPPKIRFILRGIDTIKIQENIVNIDKKWEIVADEHLIIIK